MHIAPAEPRFKASWDGNDHLGVNDNNVGGHKQNFMSKIDTEIDFDERHQIVGCLELSAASSAYARFKFVYFFLCLSEHFGFYWIFLYGALQFGYSSWLEKYIMFLSIAGFVSSFTSSFLGRLSDRYGRKYIIALTIFIQCLPYVMVAVFPNNMWYYLYILPVIGVCGSITTLTGIMKAYIVDCLPKKFLISGFAKLISINGGASILASIFVYIIVGNEIRNFFSSGSEFLSFTTQIIMFITVGLYIFTLVLFVLFVPESIDREFQILNYRQGNPCHGISHALSNKIIVCIAFFIFFCGAAQIGMTAVLQDILLMDFYDTTEDELFDLFSVIDSDTSTSTSSTTATDNDLVNDLGSYLAFFFTLGCTLICAPCCVKCCCGKDITSMLCSMILMTISFCMIIYLLISDEWYTIVVAFVCGIFFAFGEIGFAFMNAIIAKFINSKQYGISYGLLHSIYSLTKSIAPYIFLLLFEMFINKNNDQIILSNAKPVIYIAIGLSVIGTLIAIFVVKKLMSSYSNAHQNNRYANGQVEMHHDYKPNETAAYPAAYNEGGGGGGNQLQIEAGPGGGGGGGRERGMSRPSAPDQDMAYQHPVDEPQPVPIPQHIYNPSVASSQYVVGQQYNPNQAAPVAAYQQQPNYGNAPSASYAAQPYAAQQQPQYGNAMSPNYAHQQQHFNYDNHAPPSVV